MEPKDLENNKTIDMKPQEKIDLFEKKHPVVREILGIPEILYGEKRNFLPGGSIAFSDLFSKEKIEYYHIDSFFLLRLAEKVNQVLYKIEQCHIFPGLFSLSDIYVDMNHSAYPVFFVHPEKFQLLDFEQDYEWYPEDERLFEDISLFGEEEQKKANGRFLYKIMIGSTRGNVKIPPRPTNRDYSELFYRTLPEEMKHIFETGKVLSSGEWKEILEDAIRFEEKIKEIQKEALESKNISEDEMDESEKQDEIVCKNTGVLYSLFVLLRREYSNSLTMSRWVYLLQEELEQRKKMERCELYQGFVYGDQSIYVREFRQYPSDYHVQIPQKVHEYSSVETLLIAQDYLEEFMETQGNDLKKYFEVHILCDGKIENNEMFHHVVKQAGELTKKGAKLHLVLEKDSGCEAWDQYQMEIAPGKH